MPPAISLIDVGKILFSLMFLTGCASFSGRDSETAQLHLRLGTAHLNSGDYPQALSELLIAQDLDESDSVIQNNLGLAYYFRGRADLAEIHLNRAIAINPKYTDAKNNLGRVLIDLGKSKEALKILNEATLDLTYPFPEKPYLNLGMALFSEGKFVEAGRAFLKSIDFQRDNCLAQNFLGRVLYEQKEFKKASEQLDRAAGFCLKDQFDEAIYYGALSHYQIGAKSKAEARLEELLNLYPNGKYGPKAKSMLDLIRK